MPAWLWPRSTDGANVGCIGRLGQVLHWLAMILAAALVALGGWIGTVSHLPTDGAIFAGCGVAAYFMGRGLRYILAAE